MKAHTSQEIKAHVRRGMFCLLLLVAISVIPFAVAQRNSTNSTILAFVHTYGPTKISHRTLTFAERVAYQRAIEEVYWRHRIWPKERPDSKLPLDGVMSQARLEKKVADYLRDSHALEDYWQQPITAQQLQAEMDRMVSTDPEAAANSRVTAYSASSHNTRATSIFSATYSGATSLAARMKSCNRDCT